MQHNRVKRMLEAGEVPVGTYASADSLIFFELLCKSGVDYAVIETEHGPLSPLAYDPLATYCRLARLYDVAPFVRVPTDDRLYIGKALDAGALGVIVPHFASRASAENLVNACYF